MRRVLNVVLTGLFVTMFCSLALAQEKKESMMGKGMMQGGMMCEESMMGKSLVATSDGGVIVLIGNKLQKYDKNLVLQKEAEIKMDTAGMQKMMQMMGKCPMQGKPMEGTTMGESKDQSKEKSESSTTSGQPAYHY